MSFRVIFRLQYVILCNFCLFCVILSLLYVILCYLQLILCYFISTSLSLFSYHNPYIHPLIHLFTTILHSFTSHIAVTPSHIYENRVFGLSGHRPIKIVS